MREARLVVSTRASRLGVAAVSSDHRDHVGTSRAWEGPFGKKCKASLRATHIEYLTDFKNRLELHVVIRGLAGELTVTLLLLIHDRPGKRLAPPRATFLVVSVEQHSACDCGQPSRLASYLSPSLLPADVEN